MPQIPKARTGARLEIKKRPMTFSYWPTYQGATRVGLQSSVFALDPWTIINASVKQHSASDAVRREALAFIEQARDFYTAAMSATISAARPLLLYYCFLNLAKALILRRSIHATLPQPMHGLKERLRGPLNRELEDAYLKAEMSHAGHLQVFHELLRAIRGAGLSADQDFDLMKLIPQILPGHRLWAEASNKDERFVALHEIRVMEDPKTKTIWIELLLFEDDLTRLGITHKRLLLESRLQGAFREVKTARVVSGRRLVRFEQITPTTYNHRPSDEVLNLVRSVRDYLWVTVASIPPYRRYYLYLAPTSEHAQLLPQLLSIYAVTFYLGSITRYRPHHFDRIVDSPMGPRIEEFISGQPLQFIYLMASEFAEQDVTKPSIV